MRLRRIRTIIANKIKTKFSLLVLKLKGCNANQALHCLCFVVIGTVAGSLYSFSTVVTADPKPKIPLVPVVATAVVSKDMSVFISALGLVTPIYNITVKTQINGQLLETYFTEGQIVKAGDKLALIDPRPYEAQLVQYRGELMRDKALLANAKIDLDRYKTLYSQDSISQQTLATQASLVEQYEGTVKTDQGLIDQALLNIHYCHITAPIDGRLGLLQVDPGNYVQTTDTNGIVVMNSISPTYVVLTITEDDLPKVARQVALGKTLTVQAQDRTQNELLATGTLYTIDNQIDTTTGTIKIKAIFDNKDNMLFANQFVNTRVILDTIKNATVIPTTALQYGTNGTFVFVVNDDQTVSLKYVTIAAALDGETAIVGEIEPGQQVVVEGADKLKEGTKVSLVEPQDPGSKINESV